MPKIQELQRYWVNNVEDADATQLGFNGCGNNKWFQLVTARRVLEKKIYRIFCFLDEDMDSLSLKARWRRFCACAPMVKRNFGSQSHGSRRFSGYISKSALRLCRDKLFDLARIQQTTLWKAMHAPPQDGFVCLK